MTLALPQTLIAAVADRLPLVVAAVIALTVTVVLPAIFKNDPLSKIPLVGVELGGKDKRRGAYKTKAKGLYSDAYRKFKKSVCRITTLKNSDSIIVSPDLLPELRKLPDDVISMSEAVAETLESKYTKIDTDQPLVAHMIKTNLTPALVRLNPILAEEVGKTVALEIPPCEEWTKVNINSKLLRIVAIVSGRIFVGPELCHDETYIDTAVNYTLDLMHARTAVHNLPLWLKRFKAPFLPEVRKLDERIEDCLRLLKPILAARHDGAKDPSYEKPDDMLQWMLDVQEKYNQQDELKLTNAQLALTFAAIHTTTLTSTNAFYNLAAQPELIKELREEIQTVLKQHDGVFTSLALQQMKKMDSVLKETMRLHPPGFASFERKVLKPVTLSTGQVIPVGVTIEAPSYGVSRDTSIYPDPEKFDGLRFYRLRGAAETAAAGEKGRASAVEAAAHNQFVSVSQNSLPFGYGRHACPGRFFAANEIKMIVARIILEYDFCNVDRSTERYPNFEISNGSVPDPTRDLLFKKVSIEI